MPKLIRLQGDASESDTEIHNTFREPIIVQPNSKVALIGISATMAQDLGNSLFQITGETDGRFTIAPKAAAGPDAAEAQLDTGIWTLYQLRQKFEEAANYSASTVDIQLTETLYQGLDHQIIYDDKFNIWTHQSGLDATNFKTDWTQDANAVIGTNTDSFDASGIVGIRQATKIIPRVYSTLIATLKNPDTVRHNLYAAKTETQQGADFGVNATDGFYNYVTNGTENAIEDNDGPVPASAGDTVTISRYGGSLLILLEDSNGQPIGTGNFGPGEYLYENVFTKNQNNEILHWSIIVENGGGVSDVETTSISNHFSSLATSVDDDTVQAYLEFAYLPQGEGAVVINNPTLSTYMGFSGDTNAIYYEGLPAKLRAPEPPQGLSENTGVVVSVDGLGKLDSHDGSAFSRSMSNMIYVLNTPDALGQLLQIDVAAPIYLNMNNKFPLNINELRVRFLAFAGGTVLKFIGKPSLTILIDSA